MRRHRAWSQARQVPVLLAIGLLPACCGAAHAGQAATLSGPCGSYACDGPGAQLSVAYSYQLPTHCGVLATRFDGRDFYVSSLYPADLPAGLDQPTDTGTMALLSDSVAMFNDPAGRQIQFVDSPPGLIGKAYPFTVHVLAGGDQLSDEKFAARLWRPRGTLPGVSGPSYGNGYTAVAGTMTLASEGLSVFSALGEPTVTFQRTAPTCD